MGKRKITCKNSSCEHYDIGCAGGGCKTCVVIGESGKCESFKKGFLYYFHIVWEALGNKNFIDYIELSSNPDLKTGLYYVMECYDLGFAMREWGDCRFVVLKNGENGKPMNYEAITKRELNMEKFNQHYTDFRNGIMPEDKLKENIKPEHQTKEVKEYGWLSPTGEFTESPFGTHEESAEAICERKGFDAEYWEWRRGVGLGTTEWLRRDFLSQAKGYCLIHNPSGIGGYIVTNQKNLTKKQKDFLYGYFMDMGDRFKAEQFIEEE